MRGCVDGRSCARPRTRRVDAHLRAAHAHPRPTYGHACSTYGHARSAHGHACACTPNRHATTYGCGSCGDGDTHVHSPTPGDPPGNRRRTANHTGLGVLAVPAACRRRAGRFAGRTPAGLKKNCGSPPAGRGLFRCTVVLLARTRLLRLAGILGVLLLGLASALTADAAATTPPAPGAFWECATGSACTLRLSWTRATATAADKDQPGRWGRVQIHGRETPARLIPLLVTDPDRYAIQVEVQVDAPAPDRPWTPTRQPVLQPLGRQPRPDLALPLSEQPPHQPLVELRRGRSRGQEIVVLALLPYYGDADAPRMLLRFQAQVTGVAPLDPRAPVAQLDRAWRPVGEPPPGPSPLSAQERIELHVVEAGIQQVSLARLVSAGLIQSFQDATFLHLYRWEPPAGHVEIPWELGPDGRHLRFYAPDPGDRWNAGAFYWLTREKTSGQTMTSRLAVGDAFTGTLRNTAWEQGAWRAPALYDSTLPGPDGDHWFAVDMRTGPGLQPVTVTVSTPARLPPAPGNAHFTLTGSAYTAGGHRLDVAGATPAALAWAGVGDWSQDFSLAGDAVQVTLVQWPGEEPDGLELDGLAWLRPVQLDFGDRGAAFRVEEAGQYRLERIPAGAALYDVTDPAAPVRVVFPDGAEAERVLESPARHSYLLIAERFTVRLPIVQGGSIHRAGPSPPRRSAGALSSANLATPHAPTLRLRAGRTFTHALGADVLYLAPGAFHAALEPLLTLRRAQGYLPALVDVQAVYDGWSGGHVDPEAIRGFLRWAAANSPRPLLAAVMVGDGTSDPHNYLGRNNTNWIPPYLAMVDPWLGETACEVCFGQLDGPDPLDDPLPDVAIGRIPAKSAAEVAAYVAKLVRYETESFPLADRARAVYVTDNYQDAEGRVDGAGNFPLSAELSIAHQPPGVEIQRVYYDPAPTHVTAPWREPDAVKAHAQALAALSQGAGFVTYFGHAHQWQWASTDLNAEPSYLLGLYDVDLLTNGAKLPIVLGMTCLTGMFQQPAFSGTTLDERMVLRADGGAAAVWGPTGLGVAYGHDALQEGFYRQFWQGASGHRRLGELTQAGLLALFTDGLCCQETLRTFALFGDPLTTPQAAAQHRLFLPAMAR